MELEQPKVGERQITIALPPEVWEILDGANQIAIAGSRQTFESFVAELIMGFTLRCLREVMAVHSGGYSPSSCSPEGNV